MGIAVSVPRALPWAVISQPFGLDASGQYVNKVPRREFRVPGVPEFRGQHTELLKGRIMDKCELEHKALDRITGWLSTVFPYDKVYPSFSWVQHREEFFEVFKETYPQLRADTIRSNLEETWRKHHSEEVWPIVCEILAAWEEWMYAWDKYPQPQQDQ